jgi:NAD kinase
VLPAESIVTVRVARSEAPVALSADGVLCARLRPGDTFTATTAALKVRLLVLPDADPFAPLRTKLGWRGTVLP